MAKVHAKDKPAAPCLAGGFGDVLPAVGVATGASVARQSKKFIHIRYITERTRWLLGGWWHYERVRMTVNMINEMNQS